MGQKYLSWYFGAKTITLSIRIMELFLFPNIIIKNTTAIFRDVHNFVLIKRQYIYIVDMSTESECIRD